MANRSPQPSCSSPCIGSSVWNWICPTGVFPLYLNASCRKLALNHRLHLRSSTILNLTLRRSVREVLRGLHCTKPAHFVTDDLRPVHCDSSGGWTLLVGPDRIR